MQSVKSDLQSIFHQYDDIQELFFQEDVSSFNINARDSHGKTLLHHACEYGLTNGVSILLANEAEVDMCDEKGYTPLHCACKNKHIHYGVCKTLIQRDPYSTLQLTQGGSGSGSIASVVTSQDEGNRTILHYACIHGDFDIVDNLLKAGFDPCAQDKLGNSPMHYACENGQLQCVRQLIATSQNPNGLLQMPNNDGVTPLSMKTPSGGTILHIACENCDVYVAAKLLEAGADTNISDVFGFTPLSVRTGSGGTILHVACDKGEINLVKKLLEAGADPNVAATQGRTILHIASMKGHFRLIEPLAPTPEFFCLKDNDGCTPLYYACKNSHLECITEFIVQIPEVICDLMNISNKYGATPLSARAENNQTILHVACKTGNVSVTKKVLEAGANPNSLDGSTFTPLILAVQYVDDAKAVDIIGILCEFKCNLNIQTSPFTRSLTALHLACELGKEKCVEILIAKGANVLVRAQGGLTPLHYACVYHHFQCARRIVVRFSKLLLQTHTKQHNGYLTFHNLRGQYGRTILHHACLRNDVEFVENLLNLGADPNVQDNDGATPLMSALRCHGSDTDMDLLSLLLSQDWEPDLKDNIGRTALHYSDNCDDIQIPLMLISAGCNVTAVDDYGQPFSDLISKESLQLINKQLLRIDCRQIICVVGYSKCGKSTIIKAFEQAQQNHSTLQRFTARLKFNARVTLDDSRTAGIDTKVITTKRLGSLIFFDFAGQSEYYVSHLAFLESALSAKESTITFIMMVDLRCSEEDRIAQCKEWLFPIKSILKDHNMLNVILIGSHLDQVGSVSTSTSSLQDTLRQLKGTLGTPQMQFIDCWGMDCRQLSSKGMTNLQNYLQSTHSAHITSVDFSQVPLGGCLLFDRLKKSENPALAITPSKIIDKLKDQRPPFPLTVKYIDSCCQDLAASGLVLYIPNREDAWEGWLILEMEEILSRIHGKLFAPDSAEFPMHHKNLANQSGLVHMEEL